MMTEEPDCTLTYRKNVSGYTCSGELWLYSDGGLRSCVSLEPFAFRSGAYDAFLTVTLDEKGNLQSFRNLSASSSSVGRVHGQACVGGMVSQEGELRSCILKGGGYRRLLHENSPEEACRAEGARRKLAWVDAIKGIRAL